MYNKDRDFWDKLREWDVMVLLETWIERRGWEGVRNRLPRGYRWGVQWASRKGKRGRAKGGMMMGVKKDLMEERKGIHVETENIILGDIKQGKERWRIIGVYVDEGIEVMAKKVENWTGRAGESHKTLLGEISMQG